MLKYYNIGLLPTDPKVNQLFIDQAHTLRHYAKGYLLGHNAKPHVTLCQFKTDTDSRLPAIWDFIKGLAVPARFVVERFAIREGTQEHAGFDWVQWQIVNDFGNLQRAIHAHLADDETYLVPLTTPETFEPHLTLARVVENTVEEPHALARELEAIAPFSVALALGRSTPNGEWLETLEIKTAD